MAVVTSGWYGKGKLLCLKLKDWSLREPAFSSFPMRSFEELLAILSNQRTLSSESFSTVMSRLLSILLDSFVPSFFIR